MLLGNGPLTKAGVEGLALISELLYSEKAWNFDVDNNIFVQIRYILEKLLPAQTCAILI